MVGLAASLSACGNYPPSPTQVTENYLYAVSEGQFASACSYLTAPSRAAMAASSRPDESCTQALARCVPKNAIKLSQDQTQLLYAGVNSSITGRHATVAVQGTAVADSIRSVSLTSRKGNWHLTSYGSGLVACVRGLASSRRHRAHHRARHLRRK